MYLDISQYVCVCVRARVPLCICILVCSCAFKRTYCSASSDKAGIREHSGHGQLAAITTSITTTITAFIAALSVGYQGGSGRGLGRGAVNVTMGVRAFGKGVGCQNGRGGLFPTGRIIGSKLCKMWR